MVPYLKPERGHELPTGGTAHGDECACCGKRYSIRYIVNGASYCGHHAPTPGAASSGGEE
jgi:hypothetical protein